MMLKTIRAIVLSSTIFISATIHAADWYRWRGPDLNGISTETGWQTKWPDEGPQRLWKASVGTGFSSMSVSQGHVYTLGNDGDETETVFCFDAVTGAPIWKYSYHCPLDPQYYEGGPSSTPAADGNRVYTISRKGDLFCLDAATGKAIWSKNVHSEFGSEIPTWGFAGSPLVEGDLLLLNVGSAGLALKKQTGELVWQSGKTVAGYSTPVVFSQGKDRVMALAAADSIELIRVADGKLIWSFPWKTQYDVNAADPILADGKMFISSGMNHGAVLLDISQGKPAVVWEQKEFRNHINSSVFWQGYFYGVDDVSSSKYELKCLSLDQGQIKWADANFGKGSLIIAGGKILGLSDQGELMVADPSPAGFKVISRAQVLGGKCWTTPILSNGRIYCRNAKGDLICLDVSGGKAGKM